MVTSKMATDANSAILLLTDNIFARQASLDLQAAGYSTTVDRVEKGWQQLSELSPAMVVLDKSWTGKLGLNFCHQLRSSGNRIPILMLIDKETVEERVACLEAGADDYLLKPYKKKHY